MDVFNCRSGSPCTCRGCRCTCHCARLLGCPSLWRQSGCRIKRLIVRYCKTLFANFCLCTTLFSQIYTFFCFCDLLLFFFLTRISQCIHIFWVWWCHEYGHKVSCFKVLIGKVGRHQRGSQIGLEVSIRWQSKMKCNWLSQPLFRSWVPEEGILHMSWNNYLFPFSMMTAP